MASTRTVVVMGVAGTGKSTIGKELADRYGWAFAEGDSFHPRANIQKMKSGVPLDDDDRWPWLRAVAEWIDQQETSGTSAVVTCSALKRSYRDLLRDGNPSVWFAHLTAPVEVLEQRIRSRKDYFMPSSLLPSQLATLEQLDPDEPGAALEDDGAPADVVDRLLAVMPETTDSPTT